MTLVEGEPMAETRPALRIAPPPPPRRLPSPGLLPPEQLRGILLHYRHRGVAFDMAWDLALGLVAWPESRRDQSDWRKAVEDTREGWRACYEGWPAEARETAVRELSRILSDELRLAG